MEYIFRINNSNIEDYIEYIPELFLYRLEQGESYFFYGMTFADTFCGIMVLEEQGIDVLVHYMHVDESYQFFQSSMIEHVMYDIYQMGAQRLVWKFLEDDQFQTKVEGLGFQVKKDDIARFEFKIEEIKKAALFSEKAKDIISLEELDNMHLRKLGNEIVELGEDIIPMPVNKNEYLADCSAVYMEGEHAKGLLLLTRDEDEKLFIPFMFSDSSNPMAILNMMRFVFFHASQKFDESESCSMYIVEPVLVKIVEKVLGIKGQYQCTATRETAYIANYQHAYEELENGGLWDFDIAW